MNTTSKLNTIKSRNFDDVNQLIELGRRIYQVKSWRKEATEKKLAAQKLHLYQSPSKERTDDKHTQTTIRVLSEYEKKNSLVVSTENNNEKERKHTYPSFTTNNPRP